MTEKPTDSESFRASATRVYRLARISLVALIFAAGWVGWHFGTWVGLILGVVGGAVVAGILFMMFSFIYAMSQDGG